MPKVSVVMPVFNAEKFVERAARSILCQTMTDLELIAVDDGSTDSSREILEALAAEDDRLRVIVQENKGEGGARIAGFNAIRGEWLYSIDADDYARPILLERCLAAAEENNADLVIFNTEMEDNQTGEITPCDFACNPSIEVGNSFCPRDYGPTLFTDFEGFVWNKLFKVSFIKEQGIEFQNVRRTADLLFSYSAIASAQMIAFIPDPLYLYRTELSTSASITSDLAPLDTFAAICALHDDLVSRGLYDSYRTTFINRAMRTVRLNCSAARNPDTFLLLYKTLVEDGGFDRLDIPTLPLDQVCEEDDFEFCEYMRSHSPLETLFFMRMKDRGLIAEYRTYSSGLRLGQDDLRRQLDDLWRKYWRLKDRASDLESQYTDLAFSRKKLLMQIAWLSKESLRTK